MFGKGLEGSMVADQHCRPQTDMGLQLTSLLGQWGASSGMATKPSLEYLQAPHLVSLQP